MYNVGKSVIVDLIIKAYCEINNFDYETLSRDGYSSMYDMCFELDDNTISLWWLRECIVMIL